ncbi:MAG: helix-turn-helix domain-containing protein [Planctomycetota bacterium]
MSDPNQASDRYLTAPEAAAYMKVSLSWLRKKTASGELPHSKLGHRVVYDREDLDEYIRRCKVTAAWDKWDRNR